MEKSCLNCKWNSYNAKLKEFAKIKNRFKRAYVIWDWEFTGRKAMDYRHMKCLNPNVYRENESARYVYGENSPETKENLFCNIARDKSFSNYHLCGKEGDFFEKNIDNSI